MGDCEKHHSSSNIPIISMENTQNYLYIFLYGKFQKAQRQCYALYFLPSGIGKTSTQVNNFPDMSKVSEGDLNVPVFSDAFLHYNKSK